MPEIRAIIRPCGLAPAKAKNIHALSQLLLERHGGAVPRSFEELEALPGVGHKTASVVMAQAFGVPAFPVDTHIHRLAERWGLSSGRNVVETERDLKALFPETGVEPAPPADHLLRPRALPGARARSGGLPDLQLGRRRSASGPDPRKPQQRPDRLGLAREVDLARDEPVVVVRRDRAAPA